MFGNDRTKGDIFTPGTIGNFSKPGVPDSTHASAAGMNNYATQGQDFKHLLEES